MHKNRPSEHDMGADIQNITKDLVTSPSYSLDEDMATKKAT